MDRFCTSKCAVSLLLCLAMLTLAITQTSYAQPRYGGTLVVGLSSEPPSLTPLGPSTWVFHQAVCLVCNSLVAFDPETLEWIPELAESWEINIVGQKMSVKFNLVRNATWHDGEPFTSADVKFSYEEPGPVINSFLKRLKDVYLESIETPDEHTVIFNLNSTWVGVYFPQAFGGPGTGIMPKHLYENTDYLTNPYNVAPIGTGPFKFKEWKKGEYIIYERNENYWKEGLPYLDRIIFRIIPDATAMATAFEKGEIDYIWSYGLTFNDAIRLQEAIGRGELIGKRVWFFASPGASVDILGLNQNPEGPVQLKDARVRRAIVAAIDRQVLAELAYFGRANAMDNVLSTAPVNAPYFDPTIKEQSYDPDLAETLLDEAGFQRGTDGVRFSLTITIDPIAYPAQLKMAELIRDFLGDVGIEVSIITLETAAWHETVFKNWDFDMSILPYVQGPGHTFFIQYFTERGMIHGSWSNCHGYNNPEVNDLLYEAEYEINMTRHVELVRSALRIMEADQAAGWLIERNFIGALNIEFSDEYQPGVWEHAWGTAYLRPEGIYWIKGEVSTPTPQPTATPQPPVEFEVVPSWVYAVVAAAVIAIILAVAAVVYTLRRKK